MNLAPPLGMLECRPLKLSGAADMTEPSYEELKARVAELEKQAGRRQKGTLEFRVGEKAGVSVYGLGRFSVTLYYEQGCGYLNRLTSYGLSSKRTRGS